MFSILSKLTWMDYVAAFSLIAAVCLAISLWNPPKRP